jgi:YD repeat-containing protein
MKGYKATYNMKCLTLTYEVGKTYEINSVEICRRGFHFCEKMEDVLGYYAYGDDFVLLEVEALGDIETKYDKSVTNKMKVLRVVPREEYTFNAVEEWKEYDANGNLIHYKNSNGEEYWIEYDANGNSIHHKDSNEFEEWKEYDANGNLIHCKNSFGDEYWMEYDANGNLIHHKNTEGIEWNITIK